MSIIEHALNRLNTAVSNLDKAIYLQDARRAGDVLVNAPAARQGGKAAGGGALPGQQDMFFNEDLYNKNKLVSEKLNVAIRKVEKILEDA